MLVELAIGDAYGAGFEYAPPEFVTRHNTLAGYAKNPTHPGLFPGRYTDDTQMSLAICEHCSPAPHGPPSTSPTGS